MSEDQKTEPDILRIWNNFSNNLRMFIFSKVKDESDTEDILHELYLKLHDNIDKIRNDSVKAWLYRVALNLVADHFRHHQADFNLKMAASELYSKGEVSRIMDTAIMDMISMMDNLPPEYCEALCLTEIEGISQKEYAERTGLSYSGAKSRVQRARLMLKDMMLKCCHYEFDHYGTVYGIQPKCCCCC
ncbi:MAG TPA: sigma-70 family RNA polymerase sigma factor [Bacteroidales bacterium]|jgi:RNA polymerase sigma-70 factor (ECF subfamily)|nr:sigma-70 family RNA polymerase sigma factor [Bacteroidales bacterium]